MSCPLQTFLSLREQRLKGTVLLCHSSAVIFTYPFPSQAFAACVLLLSQLVPISTVSMDYFILCLRSRVAFPSCSNPLGTTPIQGEERLFANYPSAGRQWYTTFHNIGWGIDQSHWSHFWVTVSPGKTSETKNLTVSAKACACSETSKAFLVFCWPFGPEQG